MGIPSRWLLAIYVGFVISKDTSGFSTGALQSGDVSIYRKDGVLYCDKIVCPANAVKCSVSKISKPNDLKKIIRTNKCADRAGNILMNSVTVEESPSPGYPTTLNLESAADSSLSSASISSSSQNIYPQLTFPGFHGFPHLRPFFSSYPYFPQLTKTLSFSPSAAYYPSFHSGYPTGIHPEISSSPLLQTLFRPVFSRLPHQNRENNV